VPPSEDEREIRSGAINPAVLSCTHPQLLRCVEYAHLVNYKQIQYMQLKLQL